MNEESMETRRQKRTREENETLSNSEKQDNKDNKENPKREKKSLDKNLIFGPDGLGTEDHISRLPALCFREVFKHLAKTDIHNMMTVSKRIQQITAVQSPRNIKWADCKLFLFQTDKGYCFKLKVECKEYPWEEYYLCSREFSYKYEISMNYRTKSRRVSGPLIEKREVEAYSMNETDIMTDQMHKWPIPDKFFTALAELLHHHEVKTVAMDKSLFDTAFLTKLEAAFDGNMGKSRLFELSFKNRPSEIHKRLFHPDASLVQHIFRFRTVELQVITLNENWIGDLLIPHMDTIGPGPIRDGACVIDGTWRFAIDEPIKIHTIIYQIRNTQYIHEFVEGNHRITGTENGITGRFYVQDYDVDGGTMHVVFVDFYRQ